MSWSEFARQLVDKALTVAATLFAAYLMGQYEPALPDIATRPVPAWYVAVPPIFLLLAGLFRGKGGDHVDMLRDSVGLMKELNEEAQRKLRERVRGLEREVGEKHQEVEITKENLDQVQGQLDRLGIFCVLASDLFDEVLDQFYPVVMEASDRMCRAYAVSFRGRREELAKEFLAQFDAGRKEGPVPGKDREVMVFYAGMTGQYILDLACLAELAVRLPLDMMIEAEKHPGKDIGRLYVEWFERAKGEYTATIRERCLSYPPGLGADLIDYWIDQKAREEPPDESTSPTS